MANKNKNNSDPLGDILVPFFNLGNELIEQLMKFLVKGCELLFDRYVFKKTSKEETKKIEKKDLKCKKIAFRYKDLGYSITSKKPVLFSDIEKKNHTAIVGASGSGKSVLLESLMHNDMYIEKPVIFFDPKGDASSLNNFINMCRDSGREFYIFSEYYKGAGTIKLNPLKEGSITNIADRIHNAFNWSEEHYKNVCYEALKDAIRRIKEETLEVTFTNIYLMLIDFVDSKRKAKSGYTRKDIQGLITRIKNIMDSDFGERLEGEGALSFEDIRKTNKCVYIGLPVLGYAEIAKGLGKIFMGDLSYTIYNIYKIYNSYELNSLPKIGVYIDELSAIINDQFIEILNKCRGAGVQLNFAFQSPSDISKIDHHLCLQILENTSNWFIFKQRMEEGSDLFSKAIGTVPTTKTTKRFEDGKEMNFGSSRDVEENLVHSNIIKNLNIGQAVFLRHSPTRIDLVNVKYVSSEILQQNVKFLERIGEIKPIKKLLI